MHLKISCRLMLDLIIIFSGMVSSHTSASDMVFDSVHVSDIVFVVRSQSNLYHALKANNIRSNINSQAKAAGSEKAEVLLTHESWFPYGSWTILPFVNQLLERYLEVKWFFFMEEVTEIHLKLLLPILARYNSSELHFLGHGLYDRLPSINHHFAFHEDPTWFLYPDFTAGWAVSRPLLTRLAKVALSSRDIDFSIDVQHEIAFLIYNSVNGLRLTNVPEFCLHQELGPRSLCATTVIKPIPHCGTSRLDKIAVAVKTCSKFHATRVPIVKKTVGLDTKNILYFSDSVDPDIPTVYAGVPNTEKGHCQKLHNMIKAFANNSFFPGTDWLLVIDDDTLINVNRLASLLACYSSEDTVLLGERYGFQVNGKTSWGYDYITGGGGMVLSRVTAVELLRSGCRCPKMDSPDDMWLGMCFRKMGVPVIHSSSFHQARPDDYCPELLSNQYLVSFHKHYYGDPMDFYNNYLSDNPPASSAPPKMDL